MLSRVCVVRVVGMCRHWYFTYLCDMRVAHPWWVGHGRVGRVAVGHVCWLIPTLVVPTLVQNTNFVGT